METQWREIGERVRAARTARGLDQTALGRAVGVDRTSLAKVEKGGRRVTAVELLALSDALHVPMGWFLRGSAERLEADRRAGEDFDLAVELDEWAADVAQVFKTGCLPKEELLDRVAPGHGPMDLAARLRQEGGWGAEPLGSLTEVGSALGVWVLVTDVPGGAGSAKVEGGVFAAVVSSAQETLDRRYAGAREIGVCLLQGGHGQSEVRPGLPSADESSEDFAAEFLLPSSIVREVLERAGRRSELVVLAARYGAPWEAVLRALSAREREMIGEFPPGRVEVVEVFDSVERHDLAPGETSLTWQRAVLAAHEQALVTASRAVELLRGAWSMEDLVRPSSAPLARG